MDKENISNTNYCRPKVCKNKCGKKSGKILQTETELDLELKNMCCDASLQTSKLTLLVEKEINCDIGQSMVRSKANFTSRFFSDLILSILK